MVEVREIVYRVIFSHLDQIITLYSQGVSEETLVGFIEVDGILSATQDSPIGKESTELHQKFLEQIKKIKRTYVPMHAVVRIDEMTRQHYDFTVLDDNDKRHNVRSIHGGSYKKEQSEDSAE